MNPLIAILQADAQLPSADRLDKVLVMTPNMERMYREALRKAQSRGLGYIQTVASPHIKPVPAIKIDPLFPWISDAARSRMNDWLLERFGTVDVAYIFDSKVVEHFLGSRKHDIQEKMCKALFQSGA